MYRFERRGRWQVNTVTTTSTTVTESLVIMIKLPISRESYHNKIVIWQQYFLKLDFQLFHFQKFHFFIYGILILQIEHSILGLVLGESMRSNKG